MSLACERWTRSSNEVFLLLTLLFFHAPCLCHPERSATTGLAPLESDGRAVEGSGGIVSHHAALRCSPVPCPINRLGFVLRCEERKAPNRKAHERHVRRILQARNVRRWRSRENSLTRYGKSRILGSFDSAPMIL